MKCIKPFTRGLSEYGCGQCLPCRVNRRRTWTFRLVMEATQHRKSHFITLTYRDESLPVGLTLVPRHVQLFMKRIRAVVTPDLLRFYAVGEYGEGKGRPHYHVALFGGRDWLLGLHWRPGVKKTPAMVECGGCDLCRSWEHGLVHVGEISRESAAYVASYTVKKMTQVTDPRLEGRHPEFARMSLRPGIGAGVAFFFKEALVDKATGEVRDVPTCARNAGALWPLGRYLRKRIGSASGEDSRRGRDLELVRMSELQGEVRELGTKKYLELLEKGRAVRRERSEVLERIQRSKRVKPL